MPSEPFAVRIRQSLATNERFDDFAYLFDTLVLLRRPYHENWERSEEIAANLLCVFVPDKPQKYMRAMQEFRLSFRDVSDEPQLQGQFSNSVRNAALTIVSPRQIVWIPSIYFQTERDLRYWF